MPGPVDAEDKSSKAGSRDGGTILWHASCHARPVNGHIEPHLQVTSLTPASPAPVGFFPLQQPSTRYGISCYRARRSRSAGFCGVYRSPASTGQAREGMSRITLAGCRMDNRHALLTSRGVRPPLIRACWQCAADVLLGCPDGPHRLRRSPLLAVRIYSRRQRFCRREVSPPSSPRPLRHVVEDIPGRLLTIAVERRLMVGHPLPLPITLEGAAGRV